MEKRVSLLKLCKGDLQSQRLAFIQTLNKILDQAPNVDRQELAIASWALGFIACHDTFHQAVERRDIIVNVEVDGELKTFTPTR